MQAGAFTGSAQVWLSVTIPQGGQGDERWPGVWSGSPGALVDVLAAARRRLNCFQVVFKASFCSCWALPVPSREIDQQYPFHLGAC